MRQGVSHNEKNIIITNKVFGGGKSGGGFVIFDVAHSA